MRQGVFLTYLVVSCALSAYSEAAQTGPTFWLEELQDAVFDGHLEKLSVVLPTMMVLMKLGPLGRIVGPPSDTPPLPRGTQAAICASMGGFLAIVALAGGLWIHRDLVKPPVTASLDLQAGGPAQPPTADLVKLTAIVRTDLIKTLEKPPGDTKYLPAGWRGLDGSLAAHLFL